MPFPISYRAKIEWKTELDAEKFKDAFLKNMIKELKKARVKAIVEENKVIFKASVNQCYQPLGSFTYLFKKQLILGGAVGCVDVSFKNNKIMVSFYLHFRELLIFSLILFLVIGAVYSLFQVLIIGIKFPLTSENFVFLAILLAFILILFICQYVMIDIRFDEAIRRILCETEKQLKEDVV